MGTGPSPREAARRQASAQGGPVGNQGVEVGSGPQSPASPQAPSTGGALAYPGPVPPGGWHQPLPRPETLPPGVELASWGRRLAARALDVLALTVILLLLAAPGSVLLGLDPGGALGIVILVLGILVDLGIWALYSPFLVRRHGRRNGQTLGKQWLGIRVIRTNGTPVDWGMGLLRELIVKGLLFNFIGFYFFALIPWLLNYLWPLWDDHNRALHDMIVSTRVVRT